MTGLIILIAVCIAFTALALWFDHIGFDPMARLYGTDPRELVERAHERGRRR